MFALFSKGQKLSETRADEGQNYPSSLPHFSCLILKRNLVVRIQQLILKSVPAETNFELDLVLWHFCIGSIVIQLETGAAKNVVVIYANNKNGKYVPSYLHIVKFHNPNKNLAKTLLTLSWLDQPLPFWQQHWFSW